jgi:hypothetical protein
VEGPELSVIKAGDLVRVQASGGGRAATGKTILISANQLAIAVGFEDSPPFRLSGVSGMAIHPVHGIVLFATRQTAESRLWQEMIGGGEFSIDPVEPVQ